MIKVQNIARGVDREKVITSRKRRNSGKLCVGDYVCAVGNGVTCYGFITSTTGTHYKVSGRPVGRELFHHLDTIRVITKSKSLISR